MNKNQNKKKELTDEQLERIFEKIWNNWESRRRCEKAHVPEYLKRKNEEDNITD